MSSRMHHAPSSTGAGVMSAAANGVGAATTTTITEAEKQVPSVFEMPIPTWRPRLHPGSRALGAPDVYVRQADDPPPPEDELSEANVKNGLNTRPAVGNETFSAHDMIYDRLKGKAVVNQLSALFDEVVQRRAMLTSLRCGPVASQYRQPQRVTLNEVKLAAYVKELADPSVPLRKLARSVPHGYRGERMLDMLWNGGSLASALAAVKQSASMSGAGSAGVNGAASQEARAPASVSIERAVWFVRVVGASEISSSRLRQSKSGVYTAEWTGVLMGWLRRQVVELNIVHHHPHHHLSASAESPASSSPHSSRTFVKQSPSQTHPASTPQRIEEPYALILDDDFRQRWMTKWNYSLALLRALLYESLIDVQVAARMAIEMLRTANVAQIYVVLALMEEFLGSIAESVTLSSFAVEVLCVKLEDFRQADHKGRMNLALCKEMQTVLFYCLDANRENCILPSLWHKISTLVAQTDLHPRLADYATKGRNERLLNGFKEVIETKSVASQSKLELLRDMQALDDLVNQSDISSTFQAIFKRLPTLESSVSPADKIRAILLWSTSDWRSGSYRPFAGATLIHMYSQRQPKRVYRKVPSKTTDIWTLQRLDSDAVVTSWITDVDIANQARTTAAATGSTIAAAAATTTTTAAVGHPSQPLTSVSIQALIILIGELCRTGCFSIQKYIQRLTARGLTAMSGRDEQLRQRSATDESGNSVANGGGSMDSLHTKLLRSIPIFASSVPIEHQRKVAIYGNRTKESREEAMERRAMREVHEAFIWLWTPAHTAADDRSSLSNCIFTKFWSSSRHVRSRIVYRELLPAFSQYIQKAEVRASQVRQIGLLLAKAEEFPALWQVLEDVSRFAPNDERLSKLLRSFLRRHALVWTALDRRLPSVIEALILRAEPEATVSFDAASMSEASHAAEVESIVRESLVQWRELRAFRSHEQVMQTVVCRVAMEELGSQGDGTVQLAEWLQALVKTGRVERGTLSLLLCATFLHAYKDLINTLSAEERLNAFTIELLSREVVGIGEWLTRVILPSLEEESKSRNRTMLLAILQPLSSIFIDAAPSAIEEEEKHSSIVYIRFAYLNAPSAERRSDVLRLICLLMGAQDVAPEEASALRTAICSFDVVQSAVQSALIESVRLIRQFVRSPHLHTILAELLPSRWPWTSDEHIAAQISTIFDHVDALRWDQTICEIGLVIDYLRRQPGQTRQVAVQNGAESGQLARLARLACNSMLRDQSETLTKLVMSEFAKEDSGEFVNALFDERIKALNLELEATFTDEEQIRRALSAILYLFEGLANLESPVTATNAVAQSFRLVTEWFESHLSTSATPILHEESESMPSSQEARHRSDEALVVHLSIVCMLLRFHGLLNSNNSAKALAPRLFCAIVQVALSASWRKGEAVARILPLLDVATYLLQQSSVEVQQAMQARAVEHLGTSLATKPCPIHEVGNRLAVLLNSDGDASAGKACRIPPLIEAQSVSSAFVDGTFTPVTFKPWDLHPNMDPNPSDAHQTLAAKTDLNTLSNNGPVSLQFFGAYRTLDKLPDFSGARPQADPHGHSAVVAAGGITEAEFDERPPSALTSEGSYGLHAGGLPIYARDAQRGLLALKMPPNGGLEAPLHLIPALTTDKAQTPVQHASAMMTPTTSTPKSSTGRAGETILISPAKGSAGKEAEKEEGLTNGGGKKRKSYAINDAKQVQGVQAAANSVSSTGAPPSEAGAGSRKRAKK